MDDAVPTPMPGDTLDYESLLGAAEGLLDDVDAALRRLSKGTYSTCEVCGSEIGEDRLTMFPITRSCLAHS